MVEAFLKLEKNEPTKRKLPLTWTLSSLRNFIAKTMKVPVGVQKLTCILEGEEPEVMTEDIKPLNYYNLRAGCTILVEIVEEK